MYLRIYIESIEFNMYMHRHYPDRCQGLRIIYRKFRFRERYIVHDRDESLPC